MKGDRRSTEAVLGLVAGALSLGVATLVAGLMSVAGMAGGQPSPVLAVGGAFVDRTPLWLKNFAVATFGTSDKLALFVGMAVVLAVVFAAIGLVAARRLVAGMVGLTLVAALGAAAVLSRPSATGVDALATVVGGLAGMLTLRGLFGLRTRAREGGAFERRRLLMGGAGAAVVAGVAAAVGRSVGGKATSVAQSRAAVTVPTVPDPVVVPQGASVPVKGITPFVVPNEDFYRIDTALVVPQMDTKGWKLKVHGMVEREVTIDFAELTAKPLQQAMVTLTCVSNEVGGDLAGNAVWTGWPIRELLKLAGPKAGADMVLSTSIDGFTAGTPLSTLTDDRNALLAIGMNGEPLPVEHGFPVRMVVPGLYGFVSATKWVVDLKVTTYAADVAYWTPRGWSAKGPIKTASRIDVPRSGDQIKAGRVAVAGVAWAQHRGISKVEVQIDGGQWQQATLADEPTVDAWRQWVLNWDATRGNHDVVVRATDGDGALQEARFAPPAPDGATGWHQVTVTAA